ncbi:MAG: hypothetical protein F6K09_19905 [Merismopedia sp. SIO2A8]|nr:hypothetical protein [Symploca sp. SIO2B6]NET50909.1 hypothetical protein [Merismopedia sp. SIO2A8]
MSNTLDDFIQDISEVETIPVLEMRDVKRCHILVPDVAKPIGAVFHHNRYYSYVMAYADESAAHRGAQRLMKKGNQVLLTKAPRRLVLWVLEPDAKRVWSS